MKFSSFLSKYHLYQIPSEQWVLLLFLLPVRVTFSSDISQRLTSQTGLEEFMYFFTVFPAILRSKWLELYTHFMMKNLVVLVT